MCPELVEAICAGRKVMCERRADIVGIIRRDFLQVGFEEWAVKCREVVQYHTKARLNTG